MTDIFANVPPDGREFVRVVEEILAKRRQELATNSRIYGYKQFTRDELADLAYSSYKHLFRGKLRNPPRRYIVLEIAEYLEASLKELNRLLVSAGYAPEQSPLEGAELRAALEIAEFVASYWPIPSYYMTRDWTIHGWNRHLMTLYDLTDADVEPIPLEKRHVLQLIFDPTLPIYHRLRGNAETWAYTAKLNIFGFKSANLLCQHDDWYKDRVANLMALPEFSRFWKEVETDRAIPLDPIGGRPFPTYSTEITTHGRTVWVLGLFTSVGNIDFPYLVSYLPYREADRRTFAEIGLPIPGSRWESDIRSSG